MNEIIAMLKRIHGALNHLEVYGKQNHMIIVASMNDIEEIIAKLEAESKKSNVPAPQIKSGKE